MSAPDSELLWEHGLDESDKRSLKRLFARAALEQLISGERTEKSFLEALRKFLCEPEDKKLLAELIGHPANPRERDCGNVRCSPVLKIYAQQIATLLLNERPDASRTAVEKRVHELLAIDDGEFR